MPLFQGGTSGDGRSMYAFIYEANFLEPYDNTNVGGKVSEVIVRAGHRRSIWCLA
jgi:hypothetical protein